jgi:hypothetical protein
MQHSCVFATFSAPSFARSTRGQCAARQFCRTVPAATPTPARPGHLMPNPARRERSRLAQAMCPDCYDYTAAVLRRPAGGQRRQGHPDDPADQRAANPEEAAAAEGGSVVTAHGDPEFCTARATRRPMTASRPHQAPHHWRRSRAIPRNRYAQPATAPQRSVPRWAPERPQRNSNQPGWPHDHL